MDYILTKERKRKAEQTMRLLEEQTELNKKNNFLEAHYKVRNEEALKLQFQLRTVEEQTGRHNNFEQGEDGEEGLAAKSERDIARKRAKGKRLSSRIEA